MDALNAKSDRNIQLFVSIGVNQKTTISITDNQANIATNHHIFIPFMSKNKKWNSINVAKIKVIDPNISCKPNKYMIDKIYVTKVIIINISDLREIFFNNLVIFFLKYHA